MVSRGHIVSAVIVQVFGLFVIGYWADFFHTDLATLLVAFPPNLHQTFLTPTYY